MQVNKILINVFRFRVYLYQCIYVFPYCIQYDLYLNITFIFYLKKLQFIKCIINFLEISNMYDISINVFYFHDNLFIYSVQYI